MKIWFIMDKKISFLTKYTNFSYTHLTVREFKNKIKKKIKPDVIIILAEIANKLTSNSAFYGFELATLLRREHKLLCPVVITSTFDKGTFESLSQKETQKYNILYGAGTHFIRLNEIYSKLEKNTFEMYLKGLPFISMTIIEDMVEMLFQQKGFLIDKTTHDLKFSLERKGLRGALDAISYHLSTRQKDAIGFSEIAEDLIYAHQKNEEFSFINAKKKLIYTIEQYLSEPSNKTVEREENSTGKILIVEDDPEQRGQLEKNLQQYFELIATGNGTEAIAILEADTKNEIIAVIADWRLLKYDKTGQKTNYWQDYQGYQVLEAATNSHFVALISLTAEYDKNVHQIRNQLGIAIQVFKKQHIYAGGSDGLQWRVFTDFIRDECTKVVNLISSIPTAANWRKYSDEYRKMRLSTQWSAFEYETTQKAIQYWDYFKDSLDIETRDNINQGLQSILPLNTLQNVMIGRRVFFALYFELQRLRNDATLYFNPEQIIRIQGEDKGNAILDTYAILRNNWWDSDASDAHAKFKLYKQASKNLLKDLCIKSEDISRMFPEEKDWLSKRGISFSLQKVKLEFDEDDTN